MKSAALVLVAALLLPLPAFAAGPTDPVTVTPAPTDQGVIFSPGIRLLADIAPDYVEEEFFISGAANNYTYAENPVPDELLVLQADVPYTTRIIVRRPIDPELFNGMVVVEWWNSTAGFDTAPVWDPSAEYFVEEGIIYVGVTNSTTSIGHLNAGCSPFPPFLPPTCGTRYETLDLPENGVAFEMVSQIAHLLKSEEVDRPIPLDYEVERLFHSGQSQQGGSMITYATAFHFPANDGYFVQAASSARPINFQPDCADVDAPAYPACTPRLQGDDRLVATDLPVPVFHSLTETDVPRGVSRGVRQPDTPTYHLYELAGVAHTTVHKNVEVLPAGLAGPEPLTLDRTCLNPLNTSADGPVFGSFLLNAMWANLELQVIEGAEPPTGEPMEIDAAGELVRDVYGNAKGGVRLPAVDIPIAGYTGRNVVNPDNVPGFLVNLLGIFCALGGSVTDLDQATLASLYEDNEDYVDQVTEAADQLLEDRFILQSAAWTIADQAEAVDLFPDNSCGRGGEVVLAILPLAWWRRSRARRKTL